MPRIAERMLPRVLAGLAVAGLLAGMPARAAGQSSAVSRQSEASLAASVEVPVAAAHALSQGARFSVTALGASAQGVAVTVSAAGAGASFVVVLSAKAARDLGLSVGAAVVVSTVAAGWLVSDAAGRAICFVPDSRARALMHSQRIDA